MPTNKMHKDKPLVIQVDKEQDEFVRDQAWQAHISIAEYMRRLIDKAMNITAIKRKAKA